MKESKIRADTPVSFQRGSAPDAQVEPATILEQPAKVSRADGTFVVVDDDVWGIFDQAMAYVDMRKIKIDFSPNRQDRAKLWFGVTFPTQDIMRA